MIYASLPPSPPPSLSLSLSLAHRPSVRAPPPPPSPSFRIGFLSYDVWKSLERDTVFNYHGKQTCSAVRGDAAALPISLPLPPHPLHPPRHRSLFAAPPSAWPAKRLSSVLISAFLHLSPRHPPLQLCFLAAATPPPPHPTSQPLTPPPSFFCSSTFPPEANHCTTARRGSRSCSETDRCYEGGG